MVTCLCRQKCIEHILWSTVAVWLNVLVKRRLHQRQSRISEADQKARQHLINTVATTINRNRLHMTCAGIEIKKIGTIAVMRGVFPAIDVQESETASITIIEHYRKCGQLAAHILYRCRDVEKLTEVTLDPFQPNLFLINNRPDSAAQDRALALQLRTYSYSLEGASIEARQIASTPQAYGLSSESYDS